ncbi:MAG TPA: hydrogenase small subunit, partial [Candidatus Limnocylindrales bacterium]
DSVRVAGGAPPDTLAGPEAPADENWLQIALAHHGISRRRFLGYVSAMTALLALPASMTPQIVKALETPKKPVVVWLEFQDCAGNTESMLRSENPTIGDIVLDAISLEYHETIMAGAGAKAEAVLKQHVDASDIDILIVEGSVPTNDGGIYCTIGGRTALDILKTTAAASKVVIAVGACAWDGGFPRLGPTGAVGVGEVIGDKTLVNLGGCPHNVANTTATIVHYLTFGAPPALDQYNRPLFAYGHLIHDQCERRANFDAGRFVEAWGDEGHRNGWCLYKMGCKGPQATYNCPIVRWNGGTSWPIGAGHGCIACASPRFWERMTPFYARLPEVQMFGVDVEAQQIGLAAIGVVSVATAVHAGTVIARRARERRRAVVTPDGTVGPGPGPEPEPEPAAPSVATGTNE